MIGLPLFLGVDRTAGRAFTQVPGDSLRMRADDFQKEVRRQGGLARMLQLYTQALLVQISQSMACNGIHLIATRHQDQCPSIMSFRIAAARQSNPAR
jgi:hypothetical protein